MSDTKYKTATQTFIDIHRRLQEQYKGAAPEEQVYQEALELLRKERQQRSETAGLSADFQEASKLKEKASVNVDLKDLFKE